MKSTYATLALGAMAIALAGCGNSDGGAKGATQIAVKVNDDEISVHQVNGLLSRMPAQGLTPEQQQQTRSRAVGNLVDQQLFIQQAIERKLDRDPEVLASLESARRQILASAYVQKTLGPQARPNEEEIRKFYAENPALFSERKLYRLQEVMAEVPPEKRAALDAQIARAKSLQDVAAWLKAEGIRFVANAAVRGAEQLPLEALARVASLKDGELAVFGPPGGAATVLQVMQSQKVPLNEAEATPYIEQFLANRRRDELTLLELKRLRGDAKVEYVGEFAKLAQAATPVEGTTTSTAVGTSSAAPTATPATSGSTGAGPADDSMKQGLSGLK